MAFGGGPLRQKMVDRAVAASAPPPPESSMVTVISAPLPSAGWPWLAQESSGPAVLAWGDAWISSAVPAAVAAVGQEIGRPVSLDEIAEVPGFERLLDSALHSPAVAEDAGVSADGVVPNVGIARGAAKIGPFGVLQLARQADIAARVVPH